MPIFLLAAVVSAEPSPLVVDKQSVDCGELVANKPLVQTFRLKNTGTSPITISDVVGSCGCFRHELSERTIAPGKIVTLTIGINLLAQPEGANTWKVGVNYRTESTPAASGVVVLNIGAKIRKDVSVEPVAMMLLSEKEITGTLTVSDRRGKPLKVTAARVGLKDVVAEVKPAADASGRRTQQIAITVTDACAAGQYADEICIDTDDPEYRELRIPLRVIRKNATTGVQAVPGSVTLRFAKDQSTASSLVRLRNADDKEVIVEKADSDHVAIACKWAPGPGTMTTLRVTVDLAKANSAGVGVVTVRTKGPDPETILIPVSWTLP